MPVVLLSPLAGWVAALDEAPDEAFAGGALGDGVAIDPIEGCLRAPCEGEVITVAATGHAVAIRSDQGAEVLIHVGIDTVALQGAGFQVHVAGGRRVRAGDPLLDFDLDRVGRGARSLITPVLVTNPDRFEIVRRAQGLVGQGELLLELRERRATAGAARPVGQVGGASIRFLCGLPDGVHARPAARIVAAARAAGVEVTVGAHGRTTSARSALGLMGLGVRRGDAVTLLADGRETPAVFAALKETFAALPDSEAPPPVKPGPNRVLLGVKGAGGVAIGEAFRHVAADIQPPAQGAGPPAETRALDVALANVRRRIRDLAAAATGPGGDILRAHEVLLDDPVLHEAAIEAIDGGASAGGGWRAAVRRQAGLFAQGGDQRLQARRADLLDLERQVLVQLYGGGEPARPPPGAVVLADELLPSELAALAERSIAGVAMAGGGPTSHVAIMAAAIGLPMLTAVLGLDDVESGTVLILDADAGRLIAAPDPAILSDMLDRRDRRAQRRAIAASAAAELCVTSDGQRIAIYANLGGPNDAPRAVAGGAEGCGLLRSEFLFQNRTSAPDEDEQHAAYQAVADRLDGRPLTIRTLDIGADKPAPYLPLPPEENPALGLRGVRASLWRPELLRTQIRAILRVRGDVAVLVPMVASPHEVAAVRDLLEAEAVAMGVAIPALGVMVETPAAALTVAALADRADFFSIGANDLTQYVLAMDRTQPMLAAEFDGLHPAVVALMRLAAGAAIERGRKLSVCGGLAADHAAIPLLIGLGVTELSLPPGEVAEAKALIRTLSLSDCRSFAEGAGAYADAQALRRAAAARWPQVGDGE